MTGQELLAQASVGSVIQVLWTTALFDPEAVIKPGARSVGTSRIFSCGFVADKGVDYITIGIDSMYEGTNTVPSFRSTLTIPVVNIVSAEIYGRILG
jgi:hypothetical protein